MCCNCNWSFLKKNISFVQFKYPSSKQMRIKGSSFFYFHGWVLKKLPSNKKKCTVAMSDSWFEFRVCICIFHSMFGMWCVFWVNPSDESNSKRYIYLMLIRLYTYRKWDIFIYISYFYFCSCCCCFVVNTFKQPNYVLVMDLWKWPFLIYLQ